MLRTFDKEHLCAFAQEKLVTENPDLDLKHQKKALLTQKQT
jgi:hypothetical protein